MLGILPEFLLYATAPTQLAHQGQTRFVEAPPESTKLPPESSFEIQRRSLSSTMAASSSKARAAEQDARISTDSGFVGSTSGSANTVPLCITKLAALLKGFSVRLGTSNLPDLFYQATSVAAAFAADPILAPGASGGLPSTTRLYLMKLDAVQQWLLRLLYTLMSLIIEKDCGDSARNTIFRDTYLSPNGRAVSSVFQQMLPCVMAIIADRTLVSTWALSPGFMPSHF